MALGRVRGFTYLWLLFVLALGAASLGGAAQRWSGQVQREKEREQIFRGREIADAIAAYRRAGRPVVALPAGDAAPATAEAASAAGATPGGPGPQGLEDLLEDVRDGRLRRHLRRAWTDPFTGRADWEPLLDEQGRWTGVRSRASDPSLIVLDEEQAAPGGRPRRLSDRTFQARTPVPPSAPGGRSEPNGPSPHVPFNEWSPHDGTVVQRP